MFAAITTDNGIFYFALILAIVGVCVKMYMVVFRTDDWVKLQKHEEEIKQQRAARATKLASGGIKAVGILAKMFGKK